MSKPTLNLSRFSSIMYADQTTTSLDTAPTLSAMDGYITDTQLPPTIAEGSSLQRIDAGTF